MRINALFTEVVASLRANRMRVALAVLGMATGVASVSVMIAVGEGGRRAIEQTVKSMGADLLFVELAGYTELGGLRQLRLSDITQLASHPSVAFAAPVSDCTYTDVKSLSKRSYSCIMGTTPDLFPSRRWQLAEGTFFSDDDLRSVVIGSSVAERLFKNHSAVGQMIDTPNGRFRVAGVLKTIGPSADGRKQDDDIYIHTQTFGSRFMKSDRTQLIAKIIVKMRNGVGYHGGRNAIHTVFRKLYNLPEYVASPVTVSDISSVTETMQKTRRTTSLMLAAIASVSLLVAGIGIMNIMYVAVRERTREIGLRMAIGATPRDIVVQFQMEAVGIATVGGILGVTVSYLASSLGSTALKVPMKNSLEGDLLALGAAVTIGLIFGILPARKAASLPPTVALRNP